MGSLVITVICLLKGKAFNEDAATLVSALMWPYAVVMLAYNTLMDLFTPYDDGDDW